MLLLQLGKEVFRPLDGPGHQLGEIGDKQGERDEIPLRGQLSPVDVDGVAEGLEGIKRDAHRQNDVQHGDGPGDGDRPAEGGEGLAEEIEILEEKQQPQIHHQADGQKDPPPLPPPADPQTAKVVHGSGKEDQHNEFRLPAHVKIPAGGQQ